MQQTELRERDLLPWGHCAQKLTNQGDEPRVEWLVHDAREIRDLGFRALATAADSAFGLLRRKSSVCDIFNRARRSLSGSFACGLCAWRDSGAWNHSREDGALPKE